MNILKISGIDIGSFYTGLATIYLDINTLNIIDINTMLISLDIDSNHINSIQYRLNLLSKRLYSYLYNIRPHTIVIEHPFINRFRPSAVIPLAMTRSIIENTILNFNLYNYKINMIGYSPKTIKAGIGATGDANKDDMTSRLNNIEEIKNKIDVTLLSEHEVDAIAAAYVEVLNYRNNLLKYFI